jgi:hypothetical protein
MHGTLVGTWFTTSFVDGATGAFKHAQCVHPVTRGTGSFAGATGLLVMDDRVHGQEVKTNYHGEIQLAARTRPADPHRKGAPRSGWPPSAT